MKHFIFSTFAWIFNFEVERFFMYRVKSNGLRSYQRDFKENDQYQTFVKVAYVLRQK